MYLPIANGQERRSLKTVRNRAVGFAQGKFVPLDDVIEPNSGRSSAVNHLVMGNGGAKPQMRDYDA